MKQLNKMSLTAAILLSLSALNAHAALYDRGNGMVYDSTQNITWLQDANYAKTSGASPTWYSYPDDLPVNDGQMGISEALTWASNLVYGGYSDWRLPSAKLIGNGAESFDGSTDIGYNNTRSELGHLYYELGNLAQYDISGAAQAGYGFTQATFLDAGSGLTADFLNVKVGNYWERDSGDCHIDGCTFAFSGYNGQQILLSNYYRNIAVAWAVRDGDVAQAPVPAAVWLFGSGLLGLVGIAKRKSKDA